MATNNPLSELKDVHLPEAVSVWPLAIGWYIVIGVIILIIAGLIWWQIRQRKKQQQINEIEQLLSAIETKSSFTNDDEIIGECSILLKRVAILKFPEQQPQLLFGSKWLQFLDTTGKTTEFSKGHGMCLGEIYQQQQIENKQQFFALLKTWLRSVL